MVHIAPQPKCSASCCCLNHINRKRNNNRCFTIILMLAILVFTKMSVDMFSIVNNSSPPIRILLHANTHSKSHYSDDIHLFLSCDASLKIAPYTVINSTVLNHNLSASRLYFHILVEYNATTYAKELNFLFEYYKHLRALGIADEVVRAKEGFNAGIYLYDLHFWRNNNLTKKYEYYVKLNHEYDGQLWLLAHGIRMISTMLLVCTKLYKNSRTLSRRFFDICFY
eukprot:856880_1